jgi:hypothetical protein
VKELLDYGVDPDARTGREHFLAVACRAGNHVGVARLLQKGATPARPMLRDALEGGNPRCIDKIVDELHYAGVELELDVEVGQLLLERGMLARLEVPMLQWLERNKVDLSVRSQQGSSLHELAERDGASAEVVAFLAERA